MKGCLRGYAPELSLSPSLKASLATVVILLPPRQTEDAEVSRRLSRLKHQVSPCYLLLLQTSSLLLTVNLRAAEVYSCLSGILYRRMRLL